MRDVQENGMVDVTYVNTEQQLADINTLLRLK